jgi:type I restriction enzyme S subunit
MEQNQATMPMLRFKEFGKKWTEKKYKDIYTFYPTNSLSRVKLNYESGEVKNIHYGDIHTKFSPQFDVTKEEVPYVNEEIDLSRIKDENILKEGDLLIADASEDYSDIGKTIEVVNTNNEKIISGLHTLHARPYTDDMFIGFASQLLQNWKVRHQVMKVAQGTKVLGISATRLGNISLLIPELKEQQKIASFLSAVDKKIQLLENKKALLEDYKKGVMQQLFSQKLRFKQDDGSDYPDWEGKILGNVGQTYSGLSGKTKDNFGVGKPYIQYMQIFENSTIDISNCDLVEISENENQNLVAYGDAFFTTSSETPNEIATSAVLLDNVGEMYLNSFCFGLRLNQSIVNPKFAQFLFRSEVFRRKIVPLAQGSTRYNISKTAFIKLKVTLPKLEEQTKIATFLSSLDKKIKLVNTQIENTKTFKKGLLQQMFV